VADTSKDAAPLATEELSEAESKTSGLRHLKNSYITIISTIVILLIWEVLGRQINPLFASFPTAIAEAGWKMLLDGNIITAFITSVQPLIVGYALAAVVGIPIGLLVGRYRVLEAAFGIYITAGYATPLVALVPLFVLWFGLGFAVKVAIIFSLTIFPIIINTWAGVQSVPKSKIEVGTAFVASQSQIMRKIVVPATIPHIMTGLRLGVGRGVIGMVIAEFFTAISGLGALIIQTGNSFKTADMFVPIIVVMALGIGLTALVGVLERKVAPWHRSVTGR
jgi:ABC-type nitrate/sulfonate/bicarbonate transport system permease component